MNGYGDREPLAAVGRVPVAVGDGGGAPGTLRGRGEVPATQREAIGISEGDLFEGESQVGRAHVADDDRDVAEHHGLVAALRASDGFDFQGLPVGGGGHEAVDLGEGPNGRSVDRGDPVASAQTRFSRGTGRTHHA